MNKEPNCRLNGHGFNSDGICIYCHSDDGSQKKATNHTDNQHEHNWTVRSRKEPYRYLAGDTVAGTTTYYCIKCLETKVVVDK